MKRFNGAFSRLANAFFLPCVLVFTLAAFKCGSGGKGETSVPTGLSPSDVEAATSVLRQRTETEDMVRRFKKQNFTPAQVEFAQSKYESALTKVNAALERIRQDIGGSPSSLEEADFRKQADDAVGDSVIVDSLLETALRPGVSPLDLQNYVLLNANKLPDAWVAVWKASRSLSPADKQLFLTYLDKELKWKMWQAVK